MIGDLSDSATPFGRRLPSKEEIAENGFYYYFLPPLEREFYSAALKDPGLENVIACLQETIVSILEGDPRNYHLLPRAFKTLASLTRLNNDIRGRKSGRSGRTSRRTGHFFSPSTPRNKSGSD